ncbi:MAG: hypothetical protein ABSG52_09340 [Terriglobales bacterium]|jgi:hypothetical protein
MGITTAEPVATDKTPQNESRAAKTTTRTRRSRMNSDEDNSDVRYFLAKTNTNGSAPALDREVATEGEALVEALRLGVTFYAVQEFRVVPDFAERVPQLKKEAVHSK